MPIFYDLTSIFLFRATDPIGVIFIINDENADKKSSKAFVYARPSITRVRRQRLADVESRGRKLRPRHLATAFTRIFIAGRH